jgi:hypothetical protein
VGFFVEVFGLGGGENFEVWEAELEAEVGMVSMCL